MEELTKTKMSVAIAGSSDRKLFSYELELVRALILRGHTVHMIVRRSQYTISESDLNYSYSCCFVDEDDDAAFSSAVHRELLNKDASVLFCHDVGSPAMYEQLFGGTPTVVMHSQSELIVFGDKVCRSLIWTEKIQELFTLRHAEIVLTYDEADARELSETKNINAEVVSKLVKSEASDVEHKIVIIYGDREDLERSRALSDAIIDSDVVDKSHVYHLMKSDYMQGVASKFDKSMPLFMHTVSVAIIVCDIDAKEVSDYGCVVITQGSERGSGEEFRHPVYYSVESPLDTPQLVVARLQSIFFPVAGVKKEDYGRVPYLNEKSIERYEKVFLEAIPKAIIRGRTRGW